MITLLNFMVFLVTAQTWRDTEQTPITGQFSDYIDSFAHLMLVGASILAILSAGRIYNNWNLGSGPIIKSVTNLFFGMIFMVSIYVFIRTVF